MRDVIVVGLGAMGSAVTLQLAQRGLSVVGIDRFSPPHEHGSSHGETRITRLALGEGTEFVPVVRRAHELWREIEREAGTRVLHQVGGLILGRPGNAFLERTRAAATEHAIGHENLANAELRRRFPMFAVDSDTEAYFEPEAGFVRLEAAIAAQLSLARRAGADLHLRESVSSWTASPTGAQVSTARGTLEARELVLCAGAWIGELFPQGRALFAVYPQLMHWFPIRRGYQELSAMPVFVWETGVEQREFVHATGLYGFPALDGPRGGVKVGTERYEATVDPNDPVCASEDEAAALYSQYIERLFPWLEPEPLRSLPCLYTNTSDIRFIIDRHPQHANVTIVSACSGHGFKHSPAIGEAVAELIVNGNSTIDLSPFAMPPEMSGSPGDA